MIISVCYIWKAIGKYNTTYNIQDTKRDVWDYVKFPLPALA